MKSGKSRLRRERCGWEKRSKVKAEGVQYGRLSGGVWSLLHGSQKVRSCVHLWDSFGVLLCIAGWPQTPSSPPVSAA